MVGYFWGHLVWHFTEARYLRSAGTDRAEREHKAALDALTREVRELREAMGQKPESNEKPGQ